MVEKFLVNQLGRKSVKTQVTTPVGKRWGGKRIIDILFDDRVVISLKHQENSGSIDEKNFAEVLNLEHAVLDCGYEKAYLVLNDPNKVMRTRQYLKSKKNLKAMGIHKVEVITHDTFVRRVHATAQGRITVPR